ncbi:MAG: tRNA uridine-5-carboxymethylaminomethyl(34) synthesis GTPase MnmE [Pseudomonadota bacterium]
MNEQDTIVALATPPGRGGIGVVRVSGRNAASIANTILGFTPKARYAHIGVFYNADKQVIDEGIALYFPAPHSFTGESICEFQGHGGPIIMDRLIRTILQLGARAARPGEFSERAFLNGKIDLTQAEAIADLIHASTEGAATAALRSLSGVFSRTIHQLVQEVIDLRVYVEAYLDFPEEEIDFLADGQLLQAYEKVQQQVALTLRQAQEGLLLQEGKKIALVGDPNAGKSSILNALAGVELAIVTDIPGTTRDLVQSVMQFDGLQLCLSDTAGIRDSEDRVEQEGIRRAIQAAQQADCILYVVDISLLSQVEDGVNKAKNFCAQYNIPIQRLIILMNKCDLWQGEALIHTELDQIPIIYLSAKTHEGLGQLKKRLHHGQQTVDEGVFIARRRHVDALERAQDALRIGHERLLQRALELTAEELRMVQEALGEITGVVTSDALLGEIFSRFCIGK